MDVSIRGMIPPLEEDLLDRTLANMILSPSGWRGIFAADGDEESPVKEISAAHKVIVSAGAKVFADYVKAHLQNTPHPLLILGMDTRPTGAAIADMMIRTFLGEGCRVRFAAITAAPEIMAYSRRAGKQGAVHGFVYISASHNPLGHNGLKFGLTDGGGISPGGSCPAYGSVPVFHGCP
jgi:phosphoglucomutase